MLEDILELTDVDIIDEDCSQNTSYDRNVETVCDEIKQNYNSTLKFTIDYRYISKDDTKKIISQISRQLSDLFDVYCINHSDVYVIHNSKSNTSYEYRDYVNSDYNNNVIFRQYDYYTEIADNAESDNMVVYSCIRIFFTKPNLSNVKQMMKFIKSLCNIIYHHGYFKDCILIKNTDVFIKPKVSYSYNTLSEIEYEERNLLFNIDNIYKYNYEQLETVSKWVKWFFGDIVMAEFMTLYISYNYQNPE